MQLHSWLLATYIAAGKVSEGVGGGGRWWGGDNDFVNLQRNICHMAPLLNCLEKAVQMI